jgi:ribonuclease HI
MEVTLYTDGSSRGNPGPGGWGTIILTKDTVKEIGGRDEATTNNKMELMSAIIGLEHVPHTAKKVLVNTDSEYVRKGITEWIDGWLERGWKTSAKKPVLNKELWQALLFQKKRLEERGAQVSFHYVKAHVGIPLNERADTIATMFADDETVDLYDGPRKAYTY